MKAQASLEFMNIFILFFLLVSIFSAIFIKNYGDLQEENARMQARNLASMIGEEVNKVWKAGSGFSTNMTMPEKIAGYDYSITVNSSAHVLELNTSNGFVAFSTIIPSSVEVIQWRKGGNQLFENVGGTVVVK